MYAIIKNMNQLTIKQELTLLRSAVVGLVGKDKEGNYRPEFVSEMLSSASRKPVKNFTTPEDFLKQISNS